MDRIQSSLNIEQLNSLFHDFLIIYVKPNLKTQVLELQQLLNRKTFDQTYQYLNALKRQPNNALTKSAQYDHQLKQVPVFKKTFTIQQSQNANYENRTTSEKTPYSKQQKPVWEKTNDNRSADFTINQRQSTASENEKIQSEQTKKVVLMIKKLKGVFETNHKKIQKYSKIQIPNYKRKENESLNQLKGTQNYNLK